MTLDQSIPLDGAGNTVECQGEPPPANSVSVWAAQPETPPSTPDPICPVCQSPPVVVDGEGKPLPLNELVTNPILPVSFVPCLCHVGPATGQPLPSPPAEGSS